MSSISRTAAQSLLEPIPDRALADRGAISQAFLENRQHSLREAFEHIWRLPYGRNDGAGEPLAPLAEGRGTCSSKHALLARLAAEQDVDVELRIGIYLMREANTPGVGAVLAQHGLDAIPEAHCYLVRDGRRIDVTRADAHAYEPIDDFLHEEAISPDQVGDYKRSVHRQFMATWAPSPDANGYTPNELWAIREECIEALSA